MISLPLGAETRPLDELSEMAADGRCAEAFAIMEPLEFNRAGDVEFDLLYAYCGLEIGKIGLAMLALERVLALEPANQSARAMLARAYYLLNELESARREFNLLLSLNPSPNLRETIAQYLDAIAAADPDKKNLFNGYIEIGVGHDTNVTGGSTNDLIFFPGLGQDLVVDPDGLEEDDNYTSLAAGGNYLRLIDQRRVFYAGYELFARAHGERDDQDYLFSVLRTGYNHAWTSQSLGVGLRLANWRLDGDSYQDIETINLDWRSNGSRVAQIGVGLQYDRYRHRDEVDKVLDYNENRLRLAYSRLVGEREDKLLGVSLETGYEDAINGRDDGDMDYVLVRLTGEMTFSDDFSGFLIVSRQDDDYDRVNPLFAEKRNDSQNQIIVGVSWTVRPKTSIRATLGMTETDSNLEFYDVSDNDFSVAVRWNF